VAEKMEKDEDGSCSITLTELGKSVLTLSEVLQTFESESTSAIFIMDGDKTA